MREVLAIVPRRTRIGLVGVAVVLIAWLGIGLVGADSRISPALSAAISEEPEGRFDLEIHLRVEPVRFHLNRYQEHGQLGGVDGQAIRLRRVRAESVRVIARDYWVQWIDEHHR